MEITVKKVPGLEIQFMWNCLCGIAGVELLVWNCLCGFACVELLVWNCLCGIACVELSLRKHRFGHGHFENGIHEHFEI